MRRDISARVRAAADDEGDGHGGFEAFAADVAEEEEVEPAIRLRGHDLEEVSADLLGGAVGAGDGEAGELGEGFGDEDALEFAGAFELLIDGAAWRLVSST